MAAYREASESQAQLLEALVEAGHLIPSGVPGVYGRGSDYEDVRQALRRLRHARGARRR